MRLPPTLLWQRRAPVPPAKVSRHQIVPPEVHMAQAFIRMTGVDPTQVFGQHPPVRQRPEPFGEAAAPPPPPRPPRRRLLGRLRRRCLSLVSWAQGMWARARRSLVQP